MKRIKAKDIFALLVAFWCVAIFAFSAQSGDESSVSSDGVVYMICRLIAPDLSGLDEAARAEYMSTLTFIVRKAAHFTLYFILAVLSMLNLRRRDGFERTFAAFAAVWGFCIFYAATDEFHQLFVAGRSGEPTDVLIDSSGALTGLLFYALIEKIKLIKVKKLAL